MKLCYIIRVEDLFGRSRIFLLYSYEKLKIKNIILDFKYKNAYHCDCELRGVHSQKFQY